MSIYLGNNGRILLTRNKGEDAFFTTIEPSDINAIRNRFAVDYAHEQVITGDRITVSTISVDGKQPDLDWIEGADTEITRFAHVDAAGGIRLYGTFQDAINGVFEGSVNIIDISEAQDLSIRVDKSDVRRCLAQVSNYTITTSRENLDTTSLSDYFRKQYENGLIQGQGQITCYWEFDPKLCDPGANVNNEFASYLARLCVRLQQGCSFAGYFYLYYQNENVKAGDFSVWYECQNCVITEVAMTVDAGEPITTDIKFITNGAIKLQEGYPPSYILTETKTTRGNIQGIGLEQADGGLLELNNPED